MAKPTEPYKCSFSISYEIADLLSRTTYQLGKFSMLTTSHAQNKEYASSALYILNNLGTSLRNVERRGLQQGSEVPSTPLAYELFTLFKNINRVDPYDRSILTNFENAIWKEGVPYRLSRKALDLPYPVPMHAKVDDLLNGIFAYAKANKKRIHPLILSAVLMFEIISIAPYRDYNGICGAYVAKAVLVDYDPIFAYAPTERFLWLKKEESRAAFAESVEKGDMASFLAFMLNLYSESLIYIRKYKCKPVGTTSRLVDKLLSKMEDDTYYSAAEICELLGLKSRLGVQLNYIRPALEAKKIVMSNPGAPTDRNQRYKKA